MDISTTTYPIKIGIGSMPEAMQQPNLSNLPFEIVSLTEGMS